MTLTEKQLIELVRIGLGLDAYKKSVIFSENANWRDVMNLASVQGVLAIVFDALEKLPSECLPYMDTLMDWLGQVSFMESCYEDHRNAIKKLACFYEDNGIKMMLLKGYGLSLCYPKPNHRPVGDMDVYLGHLWQYADQMVRDRLDIRVDVSHEHHTVFSFKGISVENHYDFINTKSKKSHVALEARFKDLAEEGWIKDETMSNVYYPSPNLNALFLIKHCASHFASTEMTLRQLLDWLLFVNANSTVIDWKSLYEDLEQFNLRRFANAINAIGVKHLGFEVAIFHEVESDEELVNRILHDILLPEFTEKEDGTLMKGLWVKPRRWWHNRWKHTISSPDSMWSMFWYGVHAKLLKPAHFRE